MPESALADSMGAALPNRRHLPAASAFDSAASPSSLAVETAVIEPTLSVASAAVVGNAVDTCVACILVVACASVLATTCSSGAHIMTHNGPAESHAGAASGSCSACTFTHDKLLHQADQLLHSWQALAAMLYNCTMASVSEGTEEHRRRSTNSVQVLAHKAE